MNQHDLTLIRDLAKRKLEIAHDPVNLERKRLWHRLAANEAERPMVLCESAVAFDDLPDSECHCEDDWARGVERGLRSEIFHFEKIDADHVVEPWAACNWHVQIGDFGVRSEVQYAEKAANANVASRNWDPPIKDLDRDLDKLQHRSLSVDREASLTNKARLEEVFDGILPVRMRGSFWWTMGMTGQAIDLVGLQELMMFMMTEPEGVHRLMAFLRDEHLSHARWFEEEGLLSLNNENDYIGSGSRGHTHELPQTDWQEGDPVRPHDMWVLSESQETVLVGPAQFEEFVFQYQRPLIERFGLCYYGCCEPSDNRWHLLERLPNLRRVSVSPWSDQDLMAEALGRDYVFSRKPNPALISTGDFNEEAIRRDLRSTLDAAKNCNVEIVMKDVHTLAGQPWRMARWVELVREEIAAHS